MSERGGQREPVRRYGGDRREEQRQRIIASVQKLLAENDIADLSVADILAEAKVARRTFYSYHEGKYGALADAMRAVWEAYAEAEDDLDDLPGTPGEVIAWVRQDLESVYRVWSAHEPVWVAGAKVYYLDPLIKVLGDQMQRDFVRRWVTRLALLKERGIVHPPAGDLAWTATAMCAMRDHHFFIDALAGATDGQRHQTLENLVAAWAALIGVKRTE